MYERDEREPGLAMLEAIADYFNVDMNYLLGRQTQKRLLSVHEGKVISAYRNQPQLQPTIDKLLGVGQKGTNLIRLNGTETEPSNVAPLRKPLVPGRRIPVLGSVPAGTPIEAIEDIVDEIDLPKDLANDGNEYFCLRVSGHSMDTEYSDGDYVIIRKQPTATNGDDVIAYVNGYEATLKRFYRNEDGITLHAMNPDYEDRSFTPQQVNELPVTIAGIVVEQRRNKIPHDELPSLSALGNPDMDELKRRASELKGEDDDQGNKT